MISLQPLVAIVILNWNKADLTLTCLKSISELLYNNYIVYIVDNGSTDGSPELLSQSEIIKSSKKIEFIANSQNLGYAEGNNVAIRRALDGHNSVDYIWLVNNDATVESDTLTTMVTSLENDKNIGLASPVLYRNKDKNNIECAGVRIDIKNAQHHPTIDIETSITWQQDNPNQIGVMGTAMLIRCDMIKKIGLLNSRLFAYMEDIDYSIRAIKSGYLCITVHHASVFHLERPRFVATTDAKKPYVGYYNTRNEIIVYFWHSPLSAAVKNAYWVFRKRIIKINNIIKFHGINDESDALLQGLWDGYNFNLGKFDPSRNSPHMFKLVVLRLGKLFFT
jgi:GT2 family glycosyltransferase